MCPGAGEADVDVDVAVDVDRDRAWASYQIRKIAGCACAGNVFPATDFKGNR